MEGDKSEHMDQWEASANERGVGRLKDGA